MRRSHRIRAFFVLPAVAAVLALGAGAVRERQHLELVSMLKAEIAQRDARLKALTAPLPQACTEYLVMGEGWNFTHCTPARPVRM